MTDEQIDQLVQQYAEEHYTSRGSLAPRHFENMARDVIELILRKHCIVEKSKLKAEQERCQGLLDKAMTDPKQYITTITRVGGRLALLETLFPELSNFEEDETD